MQDLFSEIERQDFNGEQLQKDFQKITESFLQCSETQLASISKKFARVSNKDKYMDLLFHIQERAAANNFENFWKTIPKTVIPLFFKNDFSSDFFMQDFFNVSFMVENICAGLLGRRLPGEDRITVNQWAYLAQFGYRVSVKDIPEWKEMRKFLKEHKK